ncbi:IS982 family transposase [Candidatus Babela massiliensis]|uniref:Transposase n=1 Tax=Candidatus Babela massiliensis TaxID=673862 RepID=V6DHI7_9BACT|nr:IS982 family transposase [Candidatus Babela massiliensis]CDK31057.1 transposase [Candidatus Babela massiliensis]
MLINIFCQIDDFCKLFEKEIKINLLPSSKIRKRSSNLTISEILTIIVYYHYSGYKTFKDYYTKHILVNMNRDFKKLVSYNRFVELKKLSVIPLALFFKLYGVANCTGISSIDSLPLKVCHIKRKSSNKVFKDIAKKGKTSVGWFYGFKLHFVINEYGYIIDCTITSGNVADNNKSTVSSITKNIFGKLVADKGYIGCFNMLFDKGIHLIHKLRSNMKNKLLSFQDKLLLRKRGIIESVGNILKNTFNLEHTRHRCQINFFANLFSALIAYSFKPSKPSFAILS